MIDFRSDTVTRPTKAMMEAIMRAEVGDDVYEDDPTIKALEARAAEMTGKEEALFLPSGTMANQVAILSHTRSGDEIILGSKCHIKVYEVGAAAMLAGVSYHLIDETDGMMDTSAISAGIRGENIHFPKTGLICVENAHGSGHVAPLSYMETIRTIARENDLPVHLDGARLFNAAVHLGTEAKAIAKYADSVMFCLSKGLASPVGSMLAGRAAFIKTARKYRKMLGGGMRQAGILAAAGLVSLETMTKRLHEDHENAGYLADALDRLPGFTVDKNARHINMVFVKSTIDMDRLSAHMRTQDILLGGYKGDYMRLVCHNDIDKKAIDHFLRKLETYLKTL